MLMVMLMVMVMMTMMMMMMMIMSRDRCGSHGADGGDYVDGEMVDDDEDTDEAYGGGGDGGGDDDAIGDLTTMALRTMMMGIRRFMILVLSRACRGSAICKAVVSSVSGTECYEKFSQIFSKLDEQKWPNPDWLARRILKAHLRV